MQRGAAVHLVTQQRVRFGALLEHFPEREAMHYWETSPLSNHVGPADLVVVDLTDASASLCPEQALKLVDRATLCLVVGNLPVTPGWLEVAQCRGVRIANVMPSASVRPRFESVLTIIAEHVSGPTPDQLAQEIVAHDPVLEGVLDLVKVICEHPWRARHLIDLAALARRPKKAVKGACATLGFTRVEHFISAIRLLAQERLITTYRMPRSQALRRVGISDASNAKRQLTRARWRSPNAFQTITRAISRPVPPASR